MKPWVLLRIITIFIMDQIFKISFGFGNFDDTIIDLNDTTEDVDFIQYCKLGFLLFIRVTVCCLIFCSSLFTFALPTRYLYLVYSHLASVSVIFLSYWANTKILNVFSEKCGNFTMIMTNGIITWDMDIIIYYFKQLKMINVLHLLLFNITLQIFLSRVFELLQAYTNIRSNHKVFNLGFIMPTMIITLIPGTHGILNIVSMLSALLPLFIILKALWLNIFTIIDLICRAYNHFITTIRNYNMNDLVLIECARLGLSRVLKIFWFLRVLQQIAYLLTLKEIKSENLFKVIKYLLIKSCNTFTAVVGMSYFVSYFYHFSRVLIEWILMVQDTYLYDIESVLTFSFYVLSVQTGLTVAEPEERFVRLYQNFYLTCGMLLIYIHSLVEPLLLSMSISQTSSFYRHLRPLLVCGFLLVLSINILTYLWSYHLVNNWLLIFSSLNIQIIIKVLVTLVIYSLNIIDGYQLKFEENLDDYVFYVKSFGSVVTFCFGVCIFLNGIYNTAFVFDGIVHAPIMCVDAYLIIWCGIRDGWKTFIKRRTIMLKVGSLADVIIDQSSEINFCPICYQNMSSAKMTNCSHCFHGTCLRKWLYLQDYCPMCHTVV